MIVISDVPLILNLVKPSGGPKYVQQTFVYTFVSPRWRAPFTLPLITTNMPRLRSVGEQILQHVNRTCIDCGVSIDRRSRRCRRCHQRSVMNRRYPPSRRPILICKICGNLVSYQSRGRCRRCYNAHRTNNPRPKRPASRYLAGSSYKNLDGERVFADELPGFESEITVAAAWGCLRRCWRAFKIANSNNDEEMRSKYANRIRNLERLLNIEINEFRDVDLSLGNSENIVLYSCRIQR